MEENNEKEEMEETNSTGSEESKRDASGKWKEFKKFRNAKKVPKLLHSLVVPSSLNLNPPKQFMNPPPSPELVADKQDPNRFFGDGVNFKAKLIGIKEVGQARGDRLAQEALIELKGNVKSSNTHKQKIIINVSVDGIKIKDEKGLNVLHHHPVHKISFIAQDISDNRAFGYVFGSPALGHNFFAIKTEKTAQQVVVAMRDLFQVVFNLRKREIQESISPNTQVDNSELHPEKSADANEELAEREIIIGSDSNGNEQELVYVNDEAVDSGPNLLDLEAEAEVVEEPRKLVSGEDDFFATPASNDPFFTDPLTFISSISSSMSNNVGGSYLTVNVSNATEFSFNSNSPVSSEDMAFNMKFDRITHSTPATTTVTNPFEVSDKYAPLADITPNLFNDAFVVPPAPSATKSSLVSDTTTTTTQSEILIDNFKSNPDFFSDLDPLGKDRPFIDKKDFFYEVKNPPKKVLNDLVQASSQRSTSPPSSDSNCSVASSQSVGSPPLSASPLPNPFTSVFSSLEPSSSGTSSPLANSDGGSSDSYLSKSNCRNSYFDDEFNLPSPVNPPPPLPPVLPPRPVSSFLPPLPPKKPTPMFKLDPPSSRHTDGVKYNNGERPGGTLPIPIPCRRIRGPVPGLSSSPRPVSSGYANTPETNSLTSVSSMSQQSDDSKSLSVSADKNVYWSSPNGNSYSARSVNNMAPSPVLPPPPPPNSLNNGVDNKCRLRNYTVNNNVEQVDNMVMMNKENTTDFETAWIMATPAERSIFHRSSDPFADDFFTSPSIEESRIESRNKLNHQNGWVMDSFIVNRDR